MQKSAKLNGYAEENNGVELSNRQRDIATIKGTPTQNRGRAVGNVTFVPDRPLVEKIECLGNANKLDTERGTRKTCISYYDTSMNNEAMANPSGGGVEFGLWRHLAARSTPGPSFERYNRKWYEINQKCQ